MIYRIQILSLTFLSFSFFFDSCRLEERSTDIFSTQIGKKKNGTCIYLLHYDNVCFCNVAVIEAECEMGESRSNSDREWHVRVNALQKRANLSSQSYVLESRTILLSVATILQKGKL